MLHRKRLFFWLIFTILAGFFRLGARELPVYALGESQSNPPVEARLTQRYPQSEWVLLNGKWDIKNPRTGEYAGNVRVPFSFLGNARLLLEKKLQLKQAAGKSAVLHLGVLVGDARVWVNDTLIYEGRQNYLPVTLPVPERYFRSENVIQVEVASQNRRHGLLPEFYPVNMPRVDYGMLDGAYLLVRPERHIQALDVSAVVQDSLATVGGSIALSRVLPDTLGYRVNFRILQDSRVMSETILPVEKNSDRKLPLPVITLNATPWSPENPRTYWIEAILDSAGKPVDTFRQPLAVRQAAVRDGVFLLNQTPQNWEGVNYIYQNTEGSSLYDPALVLQDLQDIKQRGFNAVRLVMCPMPGWFYEACDRQGLAVLQDLPFGPWTGDATAQQQVLQLWQFYQAFISDISRKHSSLVAVSPAFYPNLADPGQRRRIEIIAQDLQKNQGLPVYLNSMLPMEGLTGIDFYLMDVLGRRLIARNIQLAKDALGKALFYPAAYSKAMTFRIDSTVIAQDLLLAQEFYRQLKSAELPIEDRGNFIQTYSDFYLHLPSVQNGHTGEFYLNHIGLVDLKRQPRDLEELRKMQEFATASPVGMIREDQGAHSFLYILIGFLNIFVFLITYRRYKVFRQSLGHSIKKPHGFFINLQERIIIPYKQSFFILVVIALNGALVSSSFLYFYRNHLLADYLLSLVFFTPGLKEMAVNMVWDQALCIVVTTVSIVLLFYVLALLLKLFSLAGRTRVLYNQALAVTIWSASPFVFLLPLGVFLYSLLLMMKSYWIIIAALLYFHVWVYLRWINGIRVLIDRLYSRVFLLITLILIIILGVFAYGYETQYHVLQHFEYIKALQSGWK